MRIELPSGTSRSGKVKGTEPISIGIRMARLFCGCYRILMRVKLSSSEGLISYCGDVLIVDYQPLGFLHWS